ncbi:non-canonical purine NTP pyrophosphatase [Variovorax sp. PCZ-1]|uniref:non-canonical purine NTP pyrophosphatase n=1 Tax=Variovorax sp. PCZ-1 TaxID=2835533 RepID=UPI001BCF2C26|nr:non-canonical purine NTP pyrophosphatase [Variovorax sp. PCZ-1]MBS7808213.1 non-canonical purine NTP pyrophosphatase [Variovorax sp. PCZ-1]
MKIVLASNNKGKLAELLPLFSPLGVELITQGSLGVPEAPEPYKTFVENALTKARNAAQHTGLPSIADDAGLCIDAWGGLPGVDTAYYCTTVGYEKSDDNNRRAVLERMQGEKNRRANMISVQVAVLTPLDPQPLISVGRVQGEISLQELGDGGFGFDPVMFIPSLGKTMAQLDASHKNQISHRGQSARMMVSLIRENWLAA